MSTNQSHLSPQNIQEILTFAKNHFHEKETWISIDKDAIWTSDYIQKMIPEKVSYKEGRWNLLDLSRELELDVSSLRASLETIDIKTWRMVKDDLINVDIYRQVVLERTIEMIEEDGKVSLIELGLELDLPGEILQEFLDSGPELVFLNQKREVTTVSMQQRTMARIRGVFYGITSPSDIDSILSDYGWDASTFQEYLGELVSTKALPGELFHGDRVYIPYVYLTAQRKAVDDFFRSNGYITDSYCSTMGCEIMGKLGDYIHEKFPDAMVLSSSTVMDASIIFPPIESALLECISSSSIINLLPYLPEPLHAHAEDIVKRVLPSLMQEEAAAVIYCDYDEGLALYASSAMMHRIQSEHLPKWIQEFVAKRALEIFEQNKAATGKNASHDDSITGNGKKSKKKASTEETQPIPETTTKKKRRQRKAAAPSASDTTVTSHNTVIEDPMSMDIPSIDENIVPIHTLALHLASLYPDLLRIHTDSGYDFDQDEQPPTWQPEDDGVGPIYLFVRHQFHDSLLETCPPLLQKEYDRLVKQSKIKTSTETLGAFSKKEKRLIVQNFESVRSFPYSCFLLQLLDKAWKQLLDLEEAKEEVVQSISKWKGRISAEFTKRVTEYCLFRNDIPPGIFLFQNPFDEVSEEQELPQFCQPTSLTKREYLPIYLSCPQSKDPLQYLRDELPSGTGVALARMWKFVGGEYYQGGTKGEGQLRPGDWNAFLEIVEESCLALCGLPFKTLDKKTEKHMLFSRRMELMQELEQSSQAKDVMELTLMLLFQQVKNMVVVGDYLLLPGIFDFLVLDKKVPVEVQQKLREFASRMEKEEDLEKDEILDTVKSFGLCRDISKFTLSSE